MMFLLSFLFISCEVNGFWERGTTTPAPQQDTEPRTSFFRWQMITYWPFFTVLDKDNENRKHLSMVAGLSIDLLPISTAAILNRRTLISSANCLEPYLKREKDLRIWALGPSGWYNTPYRYRVWRVMRVLPKSNNAEHKHGPRGSHVPRHDVVVIISWDQMYVKTIADGVLPYFYQSAATCQLVKPHERAFPGFSQGVIMTGSGYESMQHIFENYKIFYSIWTENDVVDCSRYLPKWWGKFICVKNHKRFPGVQNGSPLFKDRTLVGLGCFEIRYNEDRVIVFTDLRYYARSIVYMAKIRSGDYYEYAYPQWAYPYGIQTHYQKYKSDYTPDFY